MNILSIFFALMVSYTPTQWTVIVLSPINDACFFVFLFVCCCCWFLFVCFCFVVVCFCGFFYNVTLAYVKLRSHYKKTCMIHRTESYHRPLRRSVMVSMN